MSAKHDIFHVESIARLDLVLRDAREILAACGTPAAGEALERFEHHAHQAAILASLVEEGGEECAPLARAYQARKAEVDAEIERMDREHAKTCPGRRRAENKTDLMREMAAQLGMQILEIPVSPAPESEELRGFPVMKPGAA